jgi:hypothetical protein
MFTPPPRLGIWIVAVFLAIPTALGGLRAGLISHFTFDGTLEDSGPGGNDGVYFGPSEPFYVDGHDGTPGGAIEFNGINEWVRFTYSSGLPVNAQPAFTIAVWVRGNFSQNDRRIFSEASSTSLTPIWTLGTHVQAMDGSLDSYIRTPANAVLNNHRLSSRKPFDGDWNHIAWVDDNGAVTLYINGLRDETDMSYTRTALNSDITTIGAVVRDSRAPPECCLYAGAIDELRFYDHALSEAEVRALIFESDPCPSEGDTHCLGLAVDGPLDSGPRQYRLTASARDDSGDAILYTFTADGGMGNIQRIGPQTSNEAVFTLTPGTWTLQAIVDDDLDCPDQAAGATCTRVFEVVCPAAGDTHCDDFLITGPPGGNTPGTYTITTFDATDDSDDPIFYTFRADNSVDPPLVIGPLASIPTAAFTLSSGTWTITVSVDDDLLCPDVAADATCTRMLEIPSVPSGLISRWSFDGDLDDSQPSGNDGFFVGDVGPTFTDGHDGSFEGAVLFDGFDDQVQVFQNRNLPIYAHKSYSVALWVKGPPNQVDRRVFSEGSTLSNTPLLNIGTHNTGADGTVDIFIRADNGVTVVPHLHSGLTAFDDTWHHIAWVDDNGHAVLYIDGVRDPLDVRYQTTRLTLNTTSIGGIQRAAPSHWFTGEIDDVRVYNHALSAAEVEALVPEPPGCPQQGDTTCGGLAVDGPPDNQPGLYRLTALAAVDASGDPILYTFVATSAAGARIQRGPAFEDSVEMPIPPGRWTLSVTVDDSLRCRDRSPADTCSQQLEVIGSLLSHWKFDGDLLDSGVAENHGLLLGPGPIFTEDRDGNPGAALAFDGTSNLVMAEINRDLPIASSLAIRSYSIAMWVKGGPQPDRRVYSEASTANNAPLFNIGTQNQGITGQVDIFIRNANNTTIVNHRLSQGIAFDGTWRHIAWVDDNGAAVLYIDGARDATDFTYARADMPVDTATIGGILRAAPSHWFQGEIDDVRIYNFALSAAEVQAIASGKEPPPPPPPGPRFVRGDVDSDGTISITDAIKSLAFQFTGGPRPECMDAADADDSGSLTITDAVRILNWLFTSGVAPLPPTPTAAGYPPGDCGTDPTEDLLDCAITAMKCR